MLENNLERQTTRRCKELFPEVHRLLRNGYVSVEELVRENSHNKLGLFQPLSSFPLRQSFHEEARSQPLQTSHCSPQPWELAGGARPSRRQTSKSNKCFKACRWRIKVLKLWEMLLLAHKGSLELTLSTQHKDTAGIYKSHKERLGRATKA
jgi:hypothetical protein